MKKVDPRMLSQLAILVAMEVVLSRFLSINAWNIKVGFAFVPIAVSGMLYGPVVTGIVAAVADLIGALLFPSGPFFPGFTLTAFLGGLAFGLAFYRRCTVSRIVAAVAVREIFLSLMLNSLWISIMYSSPFVPLLGTRFAQCVLTAPVQFVVILLISRTLPQHIRRAVQ